MDKNKKWLDQPIHAALPQVTNEIVIFAAIMLLAIVSRFYNLGLRVMSHDESLHTYFSWLLYRGQGYQHSPMMHGPWQFHLIALSYFLFGASDFTARIPAATFSVMMVGMTWFWRRYLGRSGGLIAGLLLVISPIMLYYGRYVREDVYATFSGLLMLYAVLRYLEHGERKHLYLFTAALVLHFLDKETSFIYTAELLIFLAIYFIAQVTRTQWKEREFDYRAFIIALSLTVILGGAAAGLMLHNRQSGVLSATETAAPANPTVASAPLPSAASTPITPTNILGAAAALSFLATAFFLIRGYGWQKIRSDRAFDLMVICGTMVLPLLSPFPIKLMERSLNVTIPTTFEEVQAMAADPHAIAVVVGFLAAMFAISIGLGLIWDREKWWKTALIFWVPYTILYTTIFTNSDGFFTGTIGSLGYWLVQQGVARGSQPWYYYILVELPIYEFLPVLGFFLALWVGFRRQRSISSGVITADSDPEAENFPNTFSLLAYWSVISVTAFSFAGEKMPWLTVHLALPLILITAWALGQIVDRTDWAGLMQRRAPLAVGAVAVFVTSSLATILNLVGPTPPFQGRDLAHLQATLAFILPVIAMLLSGLAVSYLLRDWTFAHIRRLFLLIFFAFLAVLTGRAAFRAAYINYDQATEFLVYAHGATGIKQIIAQATEISQRTTGGMGIAIAYDASAPDTGVSWPFVWYLRDFTNQRAFDQPTRSLRDSVIIIVDQKNFDKIEPAIGPDYYRTDYIRMWWPMQDYFNLVSDRDPTQPFAADYACKGLLSFFKLIRSKDYSRFCNAFTDPATRAGIIQIWLNRDYTAYAQATGRNDLTVATWQPANAMRMYIRQDVAQQIWNYGVVPTNAPKVVDPTEGKFVSIASDLIIDLAQKSSTPLNAPRSLAFAPDGTLYVADSRNHRIVHLDAQGNLLNAWGTFADGVTTPIGNGTFNEPWGVAVGPDGSVYATDTWNHRVEKFTAAGEFISAWGTFGQGDTPTAFYGPRALAVDSSGRVYVADTGNKRIVVFDADGNFLTQFGGQGLDPGKFDEPVGITVDKNGTVYVADTWNQRVQTFVPQDNNGALSFVPGRQWDVYGWFGQSLDNKPYIAVDDNLNVFVTDPEGFRVQEFDSNGNLLRTWGEYGDGPDNFHLTSGITIDSAGHVWVTDAGANRIARFTMP